MLGVAKGTLCVIVHEECDAIIEILIKRFIKFPSGSQLTDTLNGFERFHGFPRCIGAIDVTHIEILAPENYTKDYYNHKGYYSILMQAVADHRYCVTDVNIGWPGSVHDACVFKNSQLYKRDTQRTLFFTTCYNMISGVKVPPVILGDLAYPILAWLMKPFSDNGLLSSQTKEFNYRFS